MKSTHLALAMLLAMSALHAAKREPSDNLEIPDTEVVSTQSTLPQPIPPKKIIYVPIWAITPEPVASNAQQRNMFLAYIAIAGTLGKILLYPSCTYAVIERVTDIIENVLYAADIITPRSITGDDDNKHFIKSVAKYIQQEAQLLISSQQEDEATIAHKKIIQENLSP